MTDSGVQYEYSYRYLQDLEEQKRTKYKINGTATTAIEKTNPNLRVPYTIVRFNFVCNLKKPYYEY